MPASVHQHHGQETAEIKMDTMEKSLIRNVELNSLLNQVPGTKVLNHESHISISLTYAARKLDLTPTTSILIIAATLKSRPSDSRLCGRRDSILRR